MSDARADAGAAPASHAGATRTAATPDASPQRGGWRAWAELLRAPLLLSPIADVLAGWSIGFAACHWWKPWPSGSGSDPGDVIFEAAMRGTLPHLACAAGAGACLLAAGMAQNALADQADDRARKPTRPLPRGALTPAAVWCAWTALSAAALALAAQVSSPALAVAAGILLLTATYHYGLKRFRVPGCLSLGALRALDLLLGVAVVEAWVTGSFAETSEAPFLHFEAARTVTLALIYALFMFGASLHASVDDEAPSRTAERCSEMGVLLQGLALMLLCAAVMLRLAERIASPAGLPLIAAVVLPVYAGGRLLAASFRLPPGPLTGVMLSGLYLFDAGACVAHPLPSVALASASLVLLLFGASRFMKRVFPPT